MSLPGVSVTIQDGGLGVLPASADGVFATFGICSKGTPAQVYSFNDPAAVRSELGFGPLAEAVALKIAQGGGTQLAVPVTPSFNSCASAVTSVVAGTGTLAVKSSRAPIESIVVTCLTGGALGTAVFSVQVGDADAYTVTSASGWSSTGYQPTGTLTVLTFTAGTYVAADYVTISKTGVVTDSGGYTSPAITQASQILDVLKCRFNITASGAAGVARFQFAVDNWTDSNGSSVATFSSDIVVPTSPYHFAIPNTGCVVTFSSGTYEEGDNFTFTTLPSTFTNGNLQTAATALGSSGIPYSMIHVASTFTGDDDAAALTAADSLASAMDTQGTTDETAFRYERIITECPTSGTLYRDSNASPVVPVALASSASTVVAQFIDFAATRGRVGVGAGDALLFSVLTGRLHQRNVAWIVTARLAGVNRAIDPGKVLDGPLGGIVRRIYADQNTSDTLDAGRFLTLRSYQGLPGYYVTRGVTMADDTSDFASLPNGRVMDLACAVARSALLRYVNSEVRVDPETGYIDEGEALRIEAAVNAQLNAAIVATGQASASSVTLSRTTNILSTSTEPVTVRVTPLGYLRNLEMTIGFINPALSAA